MYLNLVYFLEFVIFSTLSILNASNILKHIFATHNQFLSKFHNVLIHNLNVAYMFFAVDLQCYLSENNVHV